MSAGPRTHLIRPAFSVLLVIEMSLFRVKGSYLCLAMLIVSSCDERAMTASKGGETDGALASASRLDVPIDARQQLAWLISLINERNGVMSLAEAQAHFHVEYLAQAPALDTIVTYYKLARRKSPISIHFIREERRDGHIYLRGAADAAHFPTWVEVDVDAVNGAIQGVVMDPALREETLRAIWNRMPSFAPEAQFLIAEVDQAGTCHSLHEWNADAPLAIGSTFKIYALLALLDYIDSGKASWDDDLAIQTDWKSGGNGDMEGAPDGEVYPIRVFAEKMIAESDNTATDHVIRLVGRRNVEDAMVKAHHHSPEMNMPLLLTREAFLIYGLERALVDVYRGLDSSGRRYFLDSVIGPYETRPPSIPITQKYLEDVGWFASGSDICNAMSSLWLSAKASPRAEPVLDVLSVRGKLRCGSDPERWLYCGRKGGAMPGAGNSSWILHRDDGRLFVVVVGLYDRSGRTEPDKGNIENIVQNVIDLLAEEGRHDQSKGQPDYDSIVR